MAGSWHLTGTVVSQSNDLPEEPSHRGIDRPGDARFTNNGADHQPGPLWRGFDILHRTGPWLASVDVRSASSLVFCPSRGGNILAEIAPGEAILSHYTGHQPGGFPGSGEARSRRGPEMRCAVINPQPATPAEKGRYSLRHNPK